MTKQYLRWGHCRFLNIIFASLFTNKTLKYPCTRYEDMGSWGITPLILNFGTRWGKWPALRLRLGGSHCRSGRFGEDINLLPLPGLEPRFIGHSAYSVVKPNRPSRLLESNRRCCITWNTQSAVRWIINKLNRIPTKLLNDQFNNLTHHSYEYCVM
jgi:hypothetical protein